MRYTKTSRFCPGPVIPWGGPPGGGRMGMMGMHMGMEQEFGDHEPSVIFVGLGAGSLEESMADELYTSALIAILVVLMGLGGFASLIGAQHYRVSRRIMISPP